MSGSSTVGPLVSEIAKRFESQHPNLRIDVQTGGSSRGIADAGSGLVDIGMSSRALKASEEEGRVAWPVAYDGVCFIVNKQNPVSEISPEQLVAIFTGKIDDWSQLGGANTEITVINRAAGRSELDLVTAFLKLDPGDIQPDLIAGENQQGIKMVASDVNAITYMSVGASEYEAQAGTAIKLLRLNGAAASAANVADGTFPLRRPLILITLTEPTPNVQAFIKFARSSEVHDLVREFSYVPVAD